jgi:hypothetical protein
MPIPLECGIPETEPISWINESEKTSNLLFSNRNGFASKGPMRRFLLEKLTLLGF